MRTSVQPAGIPNCGVALSQSFRSVGYAINAFGNPLASPSCVGTRTEAFGGRHKRGEIAKLAARRNRDRKSTRLNSSHGYISYAVFCLKKKKTNNPAGQVLIFAIGLVVS